MGAALRQAIFPSGINKTVLLILILILKTKNSGFGGGEAFKKEKLFTFFDKRKQNRKLEGKRIQVN